MRIAVASGKGGTGKTTVVSSLVGVWPKKLAIVDMDVEQPNLHLFLNPILSEEHVSQLEIPIVNKQRCNLCGICSDLCQFSAITLAGKSVLTFTDMCHGCSGCMILCPEKAISSGKRTLGKIIRGEIQDNAFLMGKLRVGEAMSPPLMRDINNQLELFDSNEYDFIIDCPPGTSCPAINSVLKSDLILLVTEPTPFGMYDLKLAYEAFLQLNIPMAVIINRFGLGEDKVSVFCENNNLPVICKIPYDQKIAICYSHGNPIIEASEEVRELFRKIYQRIKNLLINRL